jgi:hypothetical protein
VRKENEVPRDRHAGGRLGGRSLLGYREAGRRGASVAEREPDRSVHVALLKDANSGQANRLRGWFKWAALIIVAGHVLLLGEG